MNHNSHTLKSQLKQMFMIVIGYVLAVIITLTISYFIFNSQWMFKFLQS